MSTGSAGPGLHEARERALATLSEAAASGRLTLGEHAQRAAAARRAADAPQLDAALADLPPADAAPATSPGHPWLVGFLGGTEQRGRWRLTPHLWVAALLGGVKLDLGAAEVQEPVSTITVLALFGGVEIQAPAGVAVQLSGASILGGRSDERAAGAKLPGAPLIRLRAIAVLGGVKVTEPSEAAPGS